MDRVIKFRGFSVLFNRWIYGVGLKYDRKGKPQIYVDTGWYEVYVGSEGQFIGLKDRNETEMYDGDILTSKEYPFQDDKVYNYHGVIEWVNSECAYFVTKRLVNPNRRGISDGISENLTNYDIDEFEVIGNIYEHQHLLEGVK